jgi:hypothetical protein
VLWGRRGLDDARAKALAAQIPGPVFKAINTLYDTRSDVLKELDSLFMKFDDPINRIAIAASAAYFGNRALALEALVGAAEAVPLYAHKFWQPLFSEVRKLPGFKDFMRKGRFLDYWQRYAWPDQCRSDGADFTCD